MQHDPRTNGTQNFDLRMDYSALDVVTRTQSLQLAAPITAQYDLLGRRTQLGDSTGTTAFGYDPLSRVTAVQFPGGSTVGYDYNSRGDRTALRYPNGGPTLAYDYFAYGQLQQVRQGATPLVTMAMIRPDASRPKTGPPAPPRLAPATLTMEPTACVASAPPPAAARARPTPATFSIRLTASASAR